MAEITKAQLAWWRGALQPERLRALTNATTFERGAAYAGGGRVTQFSFDGAQLTGQVNGQQIYAVRWWRRGQTLQWSCTCPFAAEGALCKHGVAVGLAWTLAESEEDRR
jgi:uncharacterized Zn finger protein